MSHPITQTIFQVTIRDRSFREKGLCVLQMGKKTEDFKHVLTGHSFESLVYFLTDSLNTTVTLINDVESTAVSVQSKVFTASQVRRTRSNKFIW